MALSLGQDIDAGFRIFDCMDDLASFRHAPPGMQKNEEQLLATVDLVLTGGVSLYESRRCRHPNVHLFPSSVDAIHFGRARAPGIDPPDQAQIAEPRIGYFGVIDERLDLGLIATLAARRRDWSFVFIGPTAKVDPGQLPVGPNLHWLGMKPYADLPAYLRGWRAGFMPFARNEATRYISPTKTPEFLAAGLPLVSTRIKDVEASYRGLVAFADDAAGFDERLARAMAGPSASWFAKVDKKLAGQSWDATWAGISALLPPRFAATRASVAGARAHV
jgi:glycosyltransferase involved in cell wall biosynthesis